MPLIIATNASKSSSCACSFTEITAQHLLYNYQLETFKVFEDK